MRCLCAKLTSTVKQFLYRWGQPNKLNSWASWPDPCWSCLCLQRISDLQDLKLFLVDVFQGLYVKSRRGSFCDLFEIHAEMHSGLELWRQWRTEWPVPQPKIDQHSTEQVLKHTGMLARVGVGDSEPEQPSFCCLQEVITSVYADDDNTFGP